MKGDGNMVAYLVSYTTKEDMKRVKKTLMPFTALQIILELRNQYKVLKYERVNINDFLKQHPEILYDERAINEIAKDLPEIWDAVNSLINLEDMINFEFKGDK